MKRISTHRTHLTGLCAIVTVIFAVLTAGCDNNPVAPGSDNIKTGDFVSVGSGTVSSTGGTLTVGSGGGAIAGLAIAVPAGALENSRTFNVSFATIESHKLGANFHPISPMIRISNGGGYAAEPMTVRVPVTIPKGEFAMGFFYNEATGTIEGLPLLAEDDSSITVATRHFATSSISGSAKASMGAAGSDAESIGNLVIASINESILSGSATISTGFTPGTDDWEFINKGSYLAPDGHCAGQSMTSMWYYYEQKLHNAPKLNHRFDSVNTTSEQLWQDNRLGYRFASTVQCDMKWNGLLRNLMLKVRTSAPSLSWKAFAMSMLLTGEPQYVGVRKEGEGGHALVAYKIAYNQGKLWVADPNLPGNTTRVIEFNGESFTPYHSALSADEAGIDFDEIGYFAKTAFIDWSVIGSRWGELTGRRIGDDRFPTYTLWVNDGAGYELGDSLSTDLDSLSITLRDITDGGWIAYDRAGTRIDQNGGVIRLKPGKNVIGFYIVAKPTSDCEGSAVAHPGYEWVDFKWVTVNLQSTSIAPETMTGAPNTEYEWRAIVKDRPANVKYVWHFGDASSEVTKINDSIVHHTYLTNGEYDIHLEVINNTTGKLVADAYATATISSGDLLERLRQTNELTFALQSFNHYSDGSGSYESWNFVNATTLGEWPPLTWNGRNFSMSHTLVQYGGSDTVTMSMAGTMSADGLTFETATFDYRDVSIQRFGSKTETRTTTRHVAIHGFKGIDIPAGLPYWYESDATVSAMVDEMSATYRYIDGDGIVQTNYRLVSTDWNGEMPLLVASFYRR